MLGFMARSEKRADAFAERINRSSAGDDGFYTAGGFPASNPRAHVVGGRDAHGHPIHRVLMGAFLTRPEAVAAKAELKKELGIEGFARTL